MEVTLRKLEKGLNKPVEGMNQTLAQLIIGLVTVIGCFCLMVFKPDSADAALSVLSIVAGFYFGRIQSPSTKPDSSNSEDKS